MASPNGNDAAIAANDNFGFFSVIFLVTADTVLVCFDSFAIQLDGAVGGV